MITNATTPSPSYLLSQLLDYIVEQSTDTKLERYTPVGMTGLRRFARDFSGLPGIDFDRRIEGDHVWLQIQRLEARPVPFFGDGAVRSFVTIGERPTDLSPSINDTALRRQADDEQRTLGEDKARARDVERRKRTTESLVRYTPEWLAWAEDEQPRRRTMALYGELFTLKGRLKAEESASATATELVWGLGLAAWKLSAPAERSGPGGTTARATLDYQYPLLTQGVEIDLDPRTHAIAIRPRAVAPRLEFTVFGACQVPGSTDIEQQAKVFLTGREDNPPTPFNVPDYEPLLRLVAGGLDKDGRFVAEHKGPLPATDHLCVTGGWVLFSRPRSASYFIEDIARLKARLKAGDQIPDGPLCLVTPPSDTVLPYDEIVFRGREGTSATGRGSASSAMKQELYFPLPYNREQETIIGMLERAPGVSVQGPPGTGKTHTIANIVCHYLAQGRKVLVTSKGEHALEVLQEKIPEEVRPLTVALLAGDKEGMRQFQASIEAIVQTLSQLNPATTHDEIEHCRRQIDAAHAAMINVDRRVNDIATQQLAGIEIDGVTQRTHELASLVVDGRTRHGWFDDELTLDASHAPPLTGQDAQALREARRHLGTDLVYATAHLPASQRLPSVEELGHLHDALVGVREIDAAEQEGRLPPLNPLTPEVLAVARQLVEVVDQAVERVQHLQGLDRPWVFTLREKCRRPEFLAEREALGALCGEIEELSRLRSAFMQQPVTAPPEALGHSGVLEAVTRAAEGGKPFGLFAFGQAEEKTMVGAIRVSGLAPGSTEDWQHVRRYLQLHARVLSFAARWNQFAEALSIPTVAGGVEDLRTTEQVTMAARLAYELAVQQDASLAQLARRVFQNPVDDAAWNDASSLLALRTQANRHLVRAGHATAAARLSSLQEQAGGTSGPIAEELRRFIATDLGQPTQAPEEITARYAGLLAELRRIEALSERFATVDRLSTRVESAGAYRLAERLRTRAVAASGDDDTLPISWREAWNWARIRHYLDSIEARGELLTLAEHRGELERGLARLYERLVARSAWLETKNRASPKVLSALESYRVAIRRIGQGTGPNASRYRRDAQQAMLDAQGAVPCWIMSHNKVLETMPAALGAFDLVIVDEASQSNLWSLPAILRGKKILVVGDDKQTSTSGLFLTAERIDELRRRFLPEQPYARDLTPEKSLYDIASTVFAGQRVMLAEHFRCVPPIIAYSNKTFYQDQIRPLRVPRASERIDPPLVDVFVISGVRDRRDINLSEAEFIVAEIAAILRDPKLSGRTLGVVSLLGSEQAKKIDELVRASADPAELERRKFECGDAATFQGSERDIVFLTMVADAQSHHPLSGTTAEQRFNVAASRARDRMYLVRSVKPAELSLADGLRRSLIGHFNQPQEGGDSRNSLVGECESGFERDVYGALFALGYRVTPQVKAGSYRIDMVVEGANDARLAIECDGDAFHGPDRWAADMQRQRVLERAGWTFWRCFASTWTLRRDEILAELCNRLQAMGIEPLGTQDHTPLLVEYREWPPSAIPGPLPTAPGPGGPVPSGTTASA